MDTRNKKKNAKQPTEKTNEKDANVDKAEQEQAHGVEGEEPITNSGIWSLLCKIQGDISTILSENRKQSRIIEELTKSIEFEAKKREDLEEKCKNLENSLKISEEKRALEELKLDDLEQYTRKYNLEINGITQDENSTDRELVLSMAEALKVELNENDMDIVHRLKVKNGTPPIIIRFATYQAKQRLYKAKKRTRGVDWSCVFGYDTTVYINENLTKKRKSLFMETRRAVKSNQWFGCWTIDGKIFLKKTEKSKPFIIQRSEDIYKS